MARKMKDSGVAWCTSIPSEWHVARGRNILTLLERSIKDDDGVITCFRDGEVTLRSKRREDGFTISMQEIGYQGIEPGDLVVHGMDGFAGAIGIADSRGKATPVLNVLDSNQNKRYLMYYLRCCAFNGVFFALSTGIRVRSCDTNWNKIRDLLYFVPPKHEQQQIADFLDVKCASIDDVIAKTTESIEEYKKLKQAVITEVVTKGVRGKRPMKDSGIDWIGQIPKEWQCCKIRYLHKGLTDGTHGTYARLDSGRLLLSSKNVRENELEIGDNESYISEEDYQSIVACGFPQRNDVLMCCIGASIGRCILYDYDEPMAFQRSVIFIRCNSMYLPKMLRYSLLSEATLVQESFLINQSAQAGLYQGSVAEIYVTVPSLDEQQEIADYLDSKCAAIDTLIAKKQQFIDELTAYKKSLIYEYVTGKKDVPA